MYEQRSDHSKQIGIYSSAMLTSAGSETLLPAISQTSPCFKPLFDSQMGSPLVARLSVNLETDLQQLKVESKLLKHQDRVTLLACLVASRAMRQGQTRLIPEGKRDELFQRTGVFAGTSRGATTSVEEAIRDYTERRRVPTLTSPVTTFGALSSTVAQLLELNGPNGSFSATCTSGLAALYAATLLLESGRSQNALVIGSEAPLTPFTAAQMDALSVHASDWRLPFPCMPLAVERPDGSGLVLGEGAAAIFVGSGYSPYPPLAHLAGISTSMDQTPTVTGISPEGLGLQRSMREAVEMAGGEVPGLIIAHAPGTLHGDKSELRAIKAVFGEKHPPVYSPKWLVGHTFGASGLISLILAIELLQGGVLPPPPYETVFNSHFPIYGETLRSIMVNSAGFGGFTASAIVSRAVF